MIQKLKRANKIPMGIIMLISVLLGCYALALVDNEGDDFQLDKIAFDWDPYIEMSHYHSQEELEWVLFGYERDFPELVTVVELGRSVKGRSILAVRITDHPHEQAEVNEPAVKYVANMHGNEAIGRELLLALVQYLCEGYYSNDTIRSLVDSHDIWIVPTMNPDGFASAEEGECCGVKGRENSNRKDLNRDFTIINRITGNISWQFEQNFQPETKSLANFIKQRQFVLSINFHGGAIVANYPYDYPYKWASSTPKKYVASPDDAVFQRLALTYASWNQMMSNSSMLKDTCPFASEHFDHGITNGAQWYNVLGGMQDYNYLASNAFEITVELGYCKYPLRSALQPYWEANKDSLVYFIQQATAGLSGSVLDALSGLPIGDAVIQVEEIDHHINSTEDGSYWRLLAPGNYHVSVTAQGYYKSKTIAVRITESEREQFMNFYLYPTQVRFGRAILTPTQLSEAAVPVQQPMSYRATVDPDAYIRDLARRYPTLTHVYNLGLSTLKHEMNVLVISDLPKQHELGEPELKLISSIHGNELVGLELLATFAEYLLKNYGVNEEVTWLVDNTRIHILLAPNPDGRKKILEFTNGDLSAVDSKRAWDVGRANGGRVDLNRDFNYDGTLASLNSLQAETQNLITWTKANPFVLSIAYHGGSKVVCYPFDHIKNSHVADVQVFRYIAHNYVQTNPGMKSGYPCPKEWPHERFPDGYLAGGDWYPFKGGMQDVNYNFSNCLEFSIEVSCEKIPPEEELSQHWEDNRQSLITFLKMAHIGVSGFVTNSIDGSPVKSCSIAVSEIGHDIACTEKGEFWRLLTPGFPYTITASAEGFKSQTKMVFISETNGGKLSKSAQRLNFVLKPNRLENSSQLEHWINKISKAKRLDELEISSLDYNTSRDIFAAIKEVFPQLATIKFLGSEVLGGQIVSVELTAAKNVSTVPNLAVIGGIMEKDLQSVSSLTYFVLDLILAYQAADPVVSKLLEESVIHLVPYFYPHTLQSSSGVAREGGNCVSKLTVDREKDMVSQTFDQATLLQVKMLRNWLQQQPIVFVLNVMSGFEGVFVPKEVGASTESLIRGRRSIEAVQSTCADVPEQNSPTVALIKSMQSDFGISSSAVGVGCCLSPRNSLGMKNNNNYLRFSNYSKCLLSNVSSHVVVLTAQTPDGRHVDAEALKISCACNFSVTLKASGSGKHQLLLTQSGDQSITASWRNVSVTQTVHVNESETSPDVINFVFPFPYSDEKSQAPFWAVTNYRFVLLLVAGSIIIASIVVWCMSSRCWRRQSKSRGCRRLSCVKSCFGFCEGNKYQNVLVHRHLAEVFDVKSGTETWQTLSFVDSNSDSSDGDLPFTGRDDRDVGSQQRLLK